MEDLLKIGLTLFVISLLLFWGYITYKGKTIVKYLKRHYQEKWEQMGSPEPYFLIPTQKWSMFMSQNFYEEFEDGKLTAMCIKQKRMQTIFIVLAVSFFIVVGGMAIWDTYFINAWIFFAIQ